MRRDQSRESTIVTRYRAGDTLAAIGTDFSISRERVRQIVIQAGEAPRRQLRDLSAGIAMYAEGKSMADIAQALNCGQQSIAGFLRRHNVAIRRVGRPRKRG